MIATIDVVLRRQSGDLQIGTSTNFSRNAGSCTTDETNVDFGYPPGGLDNVC